MSTPKNEDKTEPIKKRIRTKATMTPEQWEKRKESARKCMKTRSDRKRQEIKDLKVEKDRIYQLYLDGKLKPTDNDNVNSTAERTQSGSGTRHNEQK